MTDLTEAQRRVLLVVDDQPAGAGYIGNQVWGNGWRKPQAYARTAGKVLRTLLARGLVRWGNPTPWTAVKRYGWTLSGPGKRMVAGLKEAGE